ncbi:MAG: hypothetical protein EXX96DRAFT_343037 [Benjaminiella poitrasii]|nr:MAG: hypothetical protein EXX96DRAFT_343037 [Benjaminiella poitrasii]
MTVQKPSSSSNKIPRPLNSFIIFRLEKQREIVKQCPGANHRDISKIISKWWREMTPEKKQVYFDQAEKLKIEHKILYPDYKFKPQKREAAPRPYKKHPQNKFIARDFDDMQHLLSLYYHGDSINHNHEAFTRDLSKRYANKIDSEPSKLKPKKTANRKRSVSCHTRPFLPSTATMTDDAQSAFLYLPTPGDSAVNYYLNRGLSASPSLLSHQTTAYSPSDTSMSGNDFDTQLQHSNDYAMMDPHSYYYYPTASPGTLLLPNQCLYLPPPPHSIMSTSTSNMPFINPFFI